MASDGLSESDVRRVDENVDPTAVTADQIEDSLNDDFEGDARQEFAEALEDQRQAVRDDARDLLSDRLATNPASGETQLRNAKGQFSAKASDVTGSPEIVDGSGTVAVETSSGTVELGTVDVDAGARGPRTDTYS
jgi:hypothetical protein